MCGIILLIGSQLKYSDQPEEIFNRQSHRGPDHSKMITFKNEFETIIVGHHRLSIINPDNENANQPFESDEDILVVNGEVYNYAELATSTVSSDCEVILFLLRDLMKQKRLTNDIVSKIISRLDADYAFIYYHKKSDTIIVGRDHVGLKPLYAGYTKDTNQLIGFSSEAKCFTGPNRKIKHVKPGTVEIHPKGSVVSRFKIKNNTMTECIVLRNLISKAVEKRIEHSDVPVCLLCSGGVDSSIITTLASVLYPHRQFKAYVIEYTGGGLGSDSFYAKLVTDPLPNVELEVFKFDFQTAIKALPDVIQLFESSDIQVIRAGIPMYLLAKHISETSDYKVILSGEGADELFMGYSYFSLKEPTNEQAQSESRRLVNNLHDFDILRAERSFSSNGLELRVPFLDRHVVNYVLEISPSLRLPQVKLGSEHMPKIEKHILRKSFEYLGIPESVLWRQKERLSDGVGFGWIPDLMRHFNQKETDEYDFIFKQLYSDSIKKIKRKIPQWALVDVDTNDAIFINN